MNAHLEERDGFTVLETTASRMQDPPADAETMVIPLAKSEVNKPGVQASLSPDLDAVPSGPSSRANTTQAKQSKKAPVLP